MSITLLIGALYGLLIGAMLWWSTRNRRANRFLALLLLVIAMRMLPYIIGYAGFFDAYPWLSFLPYNASLAFGPLLYFYVRSLMAVDPELPTGWWRHFLPVVFQLGYYCVLFTMPLAFKNDWDSTVHAPFIYPLELSASFVSVAFYWAISFRHYRGYQQWLADNVSDREDHHLEWLRNFLIALAITLLINIGFVAFDRIVAKLDYFQQFPFYVWLALLSYYLGTEGYRNARHTYPAWVEGAAVGVKDQAEPASPPVAPVERQQTDWGQRGKQWRDALVAQQWWREPDLTLASLARKLGTNTSDLSRGINEGLGLNFNELINRLRVDAVKAELTTADDTKTVLDIAFAAGFSSKASFNRSFKLYTGETPSAYRQKQASGLVSSLKS